MRKEIILNNGWIFHKGDIEEPISKYKGFIYCQSKTERKLSGPAAYNYSDRPDQFYGNMINPEKWEWVELPHDYVVYQDNDKNENCALGYLHYDNAWYRKHFNMPEGSENKRVLLRFDGIAGKSTVYLNGCLMYHNFSSYNTFEIDISDYVYYDKENVIAVYVNTDGFEGWWYQGGGIYRDVHLTVTEPVAIDLWGVYAPCKKLDDNYWQIDFETTVVNTDYENKKVTLESRVIGADGSVLAVGTGEGTVGLRDKGVIKYSTEVNNPLLWDCDNPNLYTVKTVLKLNGEETDENTTRIGFRTVEISADKGLLLNGKLTFINGVCAHQDFGLTGLAVPSNIAKYKVSLMKEMGANGYRTSHYQQTESYMDAFDEQGLLVMDEARWFESTKEAIEQLESLIKRDRNRPSVIMWSTSNEEPFHITDIGKRLHKAIAAQIKKFDYTRPITAAEDRTPDKSTIYDECDIVGINYNLKLYDTVHEMCPEKPIFASECCATGSVRDWNFDSDTSGRIRDKDVDSNEWFLGREKTYKFLRERSYVFGCYQWAAVEHRGEAAWPRICSVSGALDLFLQKKGAFYQNKSHWTKEPMAHIVPHWNFKGLEGEEIPVTVYTNCEELELFLNGRSLGKKEIEKYGHGEWSVKYCPGTLEVKGYIGGKEVCCDKRITTGKPAALKLTQDNDFTANGSDIALFTCECVDENGLVVPDAAEYVRFSISSPAKIIGTGSDICDHNNVADTERKMYMGKIRIAVKPQKGQNNFTLTAMSDNCGLCRIVISK
jgi:beta-galactosidase